MIQPRSMLKVADNTGAKVIQCFKVLGGTRARYAQLGDIIVASVKSAEPRKLVKKGDIVTDSKDNVLIKILDVSIQSAKRLVVSSSGQPFLVDDPYLKDVYYTIELATKEVDGKTYMFDYIPVLINTAVPINMNTVSIWPTITEIIQ